MEVIAAVLEQIKQGSLKSNMLDAAWNSFNIGFSLGTDDAAGLIYFILFHFKFRAER